VGALVDGRGYASATSLGALSTDLAVLGTSVSALASEVSDGRVTLDGLALTCDGLTGAVADLDGRIEVLETGALESTADLAAMLVRVGVLETGASSTAGTVASHGMRLTALEGVTDSDTLAELSCSDGSVAKWDAVAGAWACAVDAGLDAAAVGALVDGRGYASATSLGALSTDLAVLGTSVSALASEVSDGRVTLDGLALTCDGLTGAVADLDGRIEVLETGALESTADLAAVLVRVGVLETGASSTAGTVASHGTRLSALEGATDSDTLAELSCADGSVAKWDAVAGAWACDTDLDADTLGALGCASGELAKWTGTGWSCAADLTLTEVQVDAYASNNGYASGSDVSSLGTRVGTLETGASSTASALAALEASLNMVSAFVGVLEGRTNALEAFVGALPTVSVTGSWDDLHDVPIDLADGDDDVLASLNCASGEAVRWNGSEWICAAGSTAGPALTKANVYVKTVTDSRYGAGEFSAYCNSVSDVLLNASCDSTNEGFFSWRMRGVDQANTGALSGWTCSRSSGGTLNGYITITLACSSLSQ
jgi:hypothetical protein